MTNQFLGLMLDPFVDGRSGVAGAGGPALGFAPEREDLPDDIALAYSSVLKAPPAKAPSFEQRWTVWGGAYGGSNRTSGDPAVVGSHDLAARAAGFAAGLDYHLTPNTVVGMALAGGGTNWSLANGLGGGKSDAFQAGLYGATRWGPAYLAAAFSYTNHWMSTDRFAFAGDHLTASFNAQSYGGRVESGYRFATYYGGITPYAAIQAQSFRTPGYSETDTQRRRLRARLQQPHRHRHQKRAGRPLRSPAGGQSQRCADAARAARLGARLGERSGARRRVPGASGRGLRGQRRGSGEKLRPGVGRHRAAPRQRHFAPRQVRRRVRLALIDLRRHGHRALRVVTQAKGNEQTRACKGLTNIKSPPSPAFRYRTTAFHSACAAGCRRGDGPVQLAEREAAANPLWPSAHIRKISVGSGFLASYPLYASTTLH